MLHIMDVNFFIPKFSRSLVSGLWYLVFFFLFSCSSHKAAQKSSTPAAAEKIQISSPTLELGAQKAPEANPNKPEEKLTSKDVQIKPLPTEEKKPEGPAITAQPVPYQPTLVKTDLAVELVVGASGSMNGVLGTETKFDIATSLIQGLASQWKDLQEPALSLGVRLFGSEKPLEANDCEDSKLLFPPAPIHQATVQKGFENVGAKGKSAITFALRKAAEDLNSVNGDRIIVLLTDRKDNCGQDPCAVAKELYDGPSKIITHVVGFDIAQEDEAALRCIAQAANGVFLLARTKEELASALDESLRSTIPYNLRIKTLVGGTPLPATITVFKAGTQQIIKKEESYGIELFRLPAGAYDILVEYAQSIEMKKPSKILKGVDLTEKGKAEQEIRFDLASLTLAGRDAKGEATATHYSLFQAGSDKKVAEFDSTGEEATFFIAPGTYDLTAASKTLTGQEMALTDPNIKVSIEQGYIKHFAFQTGTLILKGENSNKEPVALSYRVTKSDNPEGVIGTGQVDASGGKIELSPGLYDIYIEGQDPILAVQPHGILKGIAMEGGAILEKSAVLVVGSVNLTAQKAGNKLAPAEFKILDSQDKKEIATIKSQDGKAEVAIAPGKYDIEAALISPLYTTPPVTRVEGVQVDEGKTIDQTLTFQLGTLRLLGRNAKEQQLNSTFTIYNGGTEESIAKAGPNLGWFEFDLAPGNYDVEGIQTDAPSDPKPTVWLRDITVEAGSVYVKEAVYTNAKLKIIGRGTNNEVVPVGFKIYEYGHDRALISGTTGQDWQFFNLIPGQYYIEASYLDDSTSQVLKKWITLKVGENEFVEKELRF